MHESERHRIILSSIEGRPVATVADLVTLTGASEATIRRDIAALHLQKKLRRVRGGAESVSPSQFVSINARPFSVNETIRLAQKRAIARAAVDLCKDGEAIIINGGTTTFQMVHPLTARRCQVFTNSFPHRRTSAQAFQEYGPFACRCHLPRTEHHPVPFRRGR